MLLMNTRVPKEDIFNLRVVAICTTCLALSTVLLAHSSQICLCASYDSHNKQGFYYIQQQQPTAMSDVDAILFSVS
jgi:hypothetical protein